MNEKVARVCIGLAMALLVIAFVMALWRLFPYLAKSVQNSPEGALLAVALIFLTTALIIRRRRSGGK